MRKMTIRLQCWYRCMVSKNNFMKFRSTIISIQARSRGHSTLKSFHEKKSASIVLQAKYRGYVENKPFHQLKRTTIVLQSLYRCKSKYEMFCRMRKMTIRLQCWYRCMVSKQIVMHTISNRAAKRRHSRSRNSALDKNDKFIGCDNVNEGTPEKLSIVHLEVQRAVSSSKVYINMDQNQYFNTISNKNYYSSEMINFSKEFDDTLSESDSSIVDINDEDQYHLTIRNCRTNDSTTCMNNSMISLAMSLQGVELYEKQDIFDDEGHEEDLSVHSGDCTDYPLLKLVGDEVSENITFKTIDTTKVDKDALRLQCGSIDDSNSFTFNKNKFGNYCCNGVVEEVVSLFEQEIDHTALEKSKRNKVKGVENDYSESLTVSSMSNPCEVGVDHNYLIHQEDEEDNGRQMMKDKSVPSQQNIKVNYVVDGLKENQESSSFIKDNSSLSFECDQFDNLLNNLNHNICDQDYVMDFLQSPSSAISALEISGVTIGVHDETILRESEEKRCNRESDMTALDNTSFGIKVHDKCEEVIENFAKIRNDKEDKTHKLSLIDDPLSEIIKQTKTENESEEITKVSYQEEVITVDENLEENLEKARFGMSNKKEFLPSIDGSSDISALENSDTLLDNSCEVIPKDLFARDCSGVNILQLKNSALVVPVSDKHREPLDNSCSIKLNSESLPRISLSLKENNSIPEILRKNEFKAGLNGSDFIKLHSDVESVGTVEKRKSPLKQILSPSIMRNEVIEQKKEVAIDVASHIHREALVDSVHTKSDDRIYKISNKTQDEVKILEGILPQMHDNAEENKKNNLFEKDILKGYSGTTLQKINNSLLEIKEHINYINNINDFKRFEASDDVCNSILAETQMSTQKKIKRTMLPLEQLPEVYQSHKKSDFVKERQSRLEGFKSHQLKGSEVDLLDTKDAIILSKVLTVTETSAEIKSVVSTGTKSDTIDKILSAKACAISAITSPSKVILNEENVGYGASMTEIKPINLKTKDINTASYTENWKGNDSPKSLMGQTSSFRRKRLSRIPLPSTKGRSLLSSPAMSDDYSFAGDSSITSQYGSLGTSSRATQALTIKTETSNLRGENTRGIPRYVEHLGGNRSTTSLEGTTSPIRKRRQSFLQFPSESISSPISPTRSYNSSFLSDRSTCDSLITSTTTPGCRRKIVPIYEIELSIDVSCWESNLREHKRKIAASCDKKWDPSVHRRKRGCERCILFSSERDIQKFNKQGHSPSIMLTRGGCHRECVYFKRKKTEVCVRLCQKCFHDTHRLQLW